MLDSSGEAVHFTRMLLPSQVRAARALLGWPRVKLAKESGVPLGTLADFESGRSAYSKSIGKLVRTFDKAGVELLYDHQDGKGAGARFKAPQGG